jgi:uracil DNA glycosylase
LTPEEKTKQSVKVWAEVKKQIEARIKEIFPKDNDIFNFIDS